MKFSHFRAYQTKLIHISHAPRSIRTTVLRACFFLNLCACIYMVKNIQWLDPAFQKPIGCANPAIYRYRKSDMR